MAALAAEGYRMRLGAVAELSLQMDEVHTIAARAARRLLERHLQRERDFQVRRAITRALEGSNRPSEEEKRRAEAARQAEEEKQRAEAARQPEEEKRRAEAARPAEEGKQRAEAARQAEEEKRRAEAARQAEEEKRSQFPPALSPLDPRIRPIKPGESLQQTLSSILSDPILSVREKVDSFMVTYASHKRATTDRLLEKLRKIDEDKGKLMEDDRTLTTRMDPKDLNKYTTNLRKKELINEKLKNLCAEEQQVMSELAAERDKTMDESQKMLEKSNELIKRIWQQ
jgi:hypothetical protein